MQTLTKCWSLDSGAHRNVQLGQAKWQVQNGRAKANSSERRSKVGGCAHLRASWALARSLALISRCTSCRGRSPATISAVAVLMWGSCSIASPPHSSRSRWTVRSGLTHLNSSSSCSRVLAESLRDGLFDHFTQQLMHCPQQVHAFWNSAPSAGDADMQNAHISVLVRVLQINSSMRLHKGRDNADMVLIGMPWHF